MKKNIWIFNHYAQGPELPGGTRHYDLAKELINKGYEVTIFASGYHYTLLKDMVDYNSKGYFRENKDGIEFIWIKTFPYKSNNWKRMVNIISYALRLNFLIPKLSLSNPDIIIGSTVHPFAALIASRFSKSYNIPFVFEIRDLWPQTFIDMKLWKNNSLVSRFFKYIEKLTIDKSSKIIVLSPLTIKYLKEEYDYDENDILLLPNGVNSNFIRPVKQNIDTEVNITYLGGIDKVHGLDFLIDLAYYCMDTGNIVFNVYGDGKERKQLEDKCKINKLNNITWHGSVSKIDVPNKLEEANLLFVSTSNVLYGSENKLYEYMACGKPIVVATSSSHNNPVYEIKCGISLDRGNVKEAANGLKEFIFISKNEFEHLGRNGQQYVLNNRTVKILGNRLNDFLKEILNDKNNIR